MCEPMVGADRQARAAPCRQRRPPRLRNAASRPSARFRRGLTIYLGCGFEFAVVTAVPSLASSAPSRPGMGRTEVTELGTHGRVPSSRPFPRFNFLRFYLVTFGPLTLNSTMAFASRRGQASRMMTPHLVSKSAERADIPSGCLRGLSASCHPSARGETLVGFRRPPASFEARGTLTPPWNHREHRESPRLRDRTASRWCAHTLVAIEGNF